MESVTRRVTERPALSENDKEPSLKIAIISQTRQLEDIGRYLQTPNGSRSVALHGVDCRRCGSWLTSSAPDLIILDSMCRDLEGLPVLEYVSASTRIR